MLHGLDVVDAYGFVRIDAEQKRDGGRPSGARHQVAVRGREPDWRASLRTDVEGLGDALAATRFDDLATPVEAGLRRRLDDLTGDFRPVLARIDHSLDNVVVDAGTTAVTGLLDWEFCVAATPAYDLAFVEHSFAGGLWRYQSEMPDRREPIRAGLRAGYADVGPEQVIEQFRANRDCYSLLAACHAMCNLEAWFDETDGVEDPEAHREQAAVGLREAVERRI